MTETIALVRGLVSQLANKVELTANGLKFTLSNELEGEVVLVSAGTLGLVPLWYVPEGCTYDDNGEYDGDFCEVPTPLPTAKAVLEDVGRNIRDLQRATRRCDGAGWSVRVVKV